MPMTVLRIDLETYSSIDLLDVGVHKYVDSDDFEVLLFGFAFDDDPVQVIDLVNFEAIPKDVLRALETDVTKKAFNAAFERTCLAKHFGRPMLPEQWVCTAVKSLYLGLPGNLDGVSKTLNLAIQKDAKGKALINYFSKPCRPTKKNGGRTRNYPEHDEAKWQQFIDYCGMDVEVERDVDRKLSKFQVPEFEQKLWTLDQRINDMGIRCDIDIARNAVQLADNYKDRLTEEAKELTGLSNPNSVSQLKQWLSDVEGVQVETLRKDDYPILLEQFETPEAKKLIGLRQDMSKSSNAKYVAAMGSLCSDGRLKGMLRFYGASRSGRWAGSIIQPHNLPRGGMEGTDAAREFLLRGDYEMIEILFDSISEVLSNLIRTMLIPSLGNRFIVADFSAIEARVLAWLAGEEWVLDVFRTHGKIYEATAANMFRVPMETISKGHSNYKYRAAGKVAVLACGYQGGPNAMANMDSKKEIDPEDYPVFVKQYREANPHIVKFWKDVEKAAVTAVKNQSTVSLPRGLKFIGQKGFLFIQLPSGRRLAYYNPRLEKVKTDFGEKLQISYEGKEQNSNHWGRLRTYGGKLVENITQAVARDCLAVALVRVNEAGYTTPLHVHDEIVADVPLDFGSVEHMGEIMGSPIDWAAGLPLRADGYECAYYVKD